MRVLVCGSREYEGWGKINFELSSLLKKPTCIIHGGASGVDSLAGLWARRNNIPEEVYNADWETHGKAAGPIRNKKMLDEGKPDMVMAFLSKNSKGTKNMLEQSRKQGIPEIVHDII